MQRGRLVTLFLLTTIAFQTGVIVHLLRSRESPLLPGPGNSPANHEPISSAFPPPPPLTDERALVSEPTRDSVTPPDRPRDFDLETLLRLRNHGLGVNINLVDREKKLTEGFSEVFNMSETERERLNQSLETARSRLLALTKANAQVVETSAEKVTVKIDPFIADGALVYDDLFQSFSDTLGPARMAAFTTLMGDRVENLFGYFGARSRTITVARSSDPQQPHFAYQDAQQMGDSHGSQNGSFRNYADLVKAFPELADFTAPLAPQGPP